MTLDPSPIFRAYCAQRDCGRPLILAELGGEGDLDWMPILALLQGMAGRNRYANADGRDLDVHAGFTERDDSNAFADRHGAAHVIGIHAGHHITMGYIAAWVTRSSALGLVENPGPARDRLVPTLTPGTAAFQEMLGAMHTEPRDVGRFRVALYLRHYATLFATFHEWRHVQRGHCDYLAARCGSALLREASGAPGAAGIEPETSRVLEFLADAAGFEDLLRLVGQDLDPLHASGAAPLLRTRRLRLMLLACGLMFAHWHALDRSRFAGDPWHPLPAERLVQLWHHWFRLAPEIGLSQDEAGAQFHRAVSDMRRAASVCPEMAWVFDATSGLIHRITPWDDHGIFAAADPDLAARLDHHAYLPIR